MGALTAAAEGDGFTAVVMMASSYWSTISGVETLQEVLDPAYKGINVKTVATITKNFNGQDLT